MPRYIMHGFKRLLSLVDLAMRVASLSTNRNPSNRMIVEHDVAIEKRKKKKKKRIAAEAQNAIDHENSTYSAFLYLCVCVYIN